MDPLSISASVVALIGAVAGALGGIQKLSVIAVGASDELFWVMNELTDLRAVLHVVDELTPSGPITSRASTNAMTTLRILADRTSQTLLELQMFIDKKLEKKLGSDKNGKPFTSKRAWVRNQPKLRMFRGRLRDCRVGMALHLSIISMKSVSAIQYDIQGLSGSCRQILQGFQQQSLRHNVSVNTSVVAIETAFGPTDSLASAEDGPLKTRESTVVKDDPTTEASYASTPLETSPLNSIHAPKSPSIFRIDVTPTAKKCGPACNCQCHMQSHIRSPAWLRRVAGHLFISYSGIPCTLGRECDRKSCHRNNQSSLRVNYVFPTVLVSRMFSFTTAWNNLIGIQMTLRVPTIIELGSRTWTIIATGNPVLLRMACNRGEAHPTDVSPTGRSLLHFAMEIQAYKVAAMLLEHRADPYAADHHNITPSHQAWMQARIMPPDSLIEDHGILGTLLTKEEEIIQSFGFSTAHQAVLGILPSSLLDIPDLIGPYADKPDTGGWTPLHWAANYDDADTLQKLINLGSTIDARNNLGETALHTACKAGSVSCISLLLVAGACAAPKMTNRGRWTPLHWAVCRTTKHIPLSIIEQLIAHGAQVDARGFGGHTVFHSGCYRPDVVRLFLANGTVNVNDATDNGYTPLMFTVKHSAVESVALLLEAGADVKLVNLKKQNILHLAAYGADLKTLRCLLEMSDLRQVDPALVDDERGMTPSQAFHSEHRLVLVADSEKGEARVVFEALVEKARILWVRGR